jgi:hypothetical protein
MARFSRRRGTTSRPAPGWRRFLAGFEARFERLREWHRGLLGIFVMRAASRCRA